MTLRRTHVAGIGIITAVTSVLTMFGPIESLIVAIGTILGGQFNFDPEPIIGVLPVGDPVGSAASLGADLFGAILIIGAELGINNETTVFIGTVLIVIALFSTYGGDG